MLAKRSWIQSVTTHRVITVAEFCAMGDNLHADLKKTRVLTRGRCEQTHTWRPRQLPNSPM